MNNLVGLDSKTSKALTKMSHYVSLIIIWFLVFMTLSRGSKAGLDFAYHKDISEHCKRRVFPSVFLTKHARDASSYTLHLTESQSPYNCMINLKTEVNNVLILVINVGKGLLPDNLGSSCTQSNNQLLIHEMGETFGGYWGPMPDKLGKQESPKEMYYTLKTTYKKRIFPTTTEDMVDIVTKETTTTTTESTEEPVDPDTISIEIPLVNVSGRLVPSDERFVDPQPDTGSLDTFDLLNDVTPKKGESYDTSIIPLLQFALSDTVMDPPPQKIPPAQKIPLALSNLLHSTRFPPTRRRITLFNTIKHWTKSYRLFTKKLFGSVEQKFGQRASTSTQPGESFSDDSLYSLLESIKNINKSEKAADTNTKLFFKNIVNKKHNTSLYRNPDLNQYFKTIVTLKDNVDESTTQLKSSQKSVTTEIPYTPRSLIETETEQAEPKTSETSTTDRKTFQDWWIPDYKGSNATTSSRGIVRVLNTTSITTASTEEIKNMKLDDITNARKSNLDVETVKYNNILTTESNKNTEITPMLSKSGEKGSLVDHESWENLVQAAPDIALLLNPSVPLDVLVDYSHMTQDNKNTSARKRDKRRLKYIPIEHAKPHAVSTRIYQSPTHDSGVRHPYEPPPLGEIMDDEIHGRSQLHHMRRYIGNVVYNICSDYTNGHTGSYGNNGPITAKRAMLFNSSRIIIAFDNFTISTLTIIATTARILEEANSRCPPLHLECQVDGTRVCINSVNACDGVPNCGASDIYDEDRMLCGAIMGFQYSICVAAVTFLAVLLTLLYTAHYWLRRCVPNVSEAFFIYTDQLENELILDTVMRSTAGDGADVDQASRMVWQGNAFDVDMGPYYEEHKQKGFFGNFRKLAALLNFYKNKTVERHLSEKAIETLENEGINSYTEVEIKRMFGHFSNDQAVQTGPSLELQNVNERSHKEQPRGHDETVHTQESIESINRFAVEQHEKYNRELKIMQVMNQVAQTKYSDDSLPKSSYKKVRRVSEMVQAGSDELELFSTYYDSPSRQQHDRSVSATVDKLQKIQKQIRFQDLPTAIPSSSQVSLEEGTKHMPTINEADEPPMNKDFNWFWAKTKEKAKMSKKKTHHSTQPR